MKTYWNNEGRFQAEYDEMVNAGFKFTKAEENVMYKYRRYYNDGDLPMGAAYAWTADIEKYLELQANIAVAKAYVRFTKNNVSFVVKAYSQKSFVGFKSFVNTMYANN